MSLTQATLAGAFVGRSAKTRRMPWFSQTPLLIVHTASAFFQATSAATAHTKGAWAQAFSSTSADTGLILLTAAGTSATATDASYMVDIGVGAAGSEVVIAQDIAVGGLGFSQTLMFALPVFVASGSRVAVRIQGAALNTGQFPSLLLARTADMHLTPRVVDTLGAVTATSRGTALSGASGSYTEIVASTSNPYQAMQLIASNGTKTGINSNFRLTIATGAAGAEVDFGTVDLQQNSSGVISLRGNPSPQPPIFGCAIPAGSRIAVKHDISANPDRIQVQAIGVPFR